jgi:hypothetical protein
MKRPVQSISRFAACLCLLGSVAAHAEPPAGQTDTAAKAVVIPRSKPQVIYHLPRSDNYSATLHSQAKARTDLLPVDPSMPTSLQLSRSSANAAALQAEAEAANAPGPSPEKATTPRPKRSVKHAPAKAPRVHVISPGRGHGNPHPGKGHKK